MSILREGKGWFEVANILYHVGMSVFDIFNLDLVLTLSRAAQWERGSATPYLFYLGIFSGCLRIYLGTNES
jgi:hypothetical protein